MKKCTGPVANAGRLKPLPSETMDALCPLIVLFHVIPFCDVADAIALCCVDRRRAARSTETMTAVFRHALARLCSMDVSALSLSQLCALYRAVRAWTAMAPAPGYWRFPATPDDLPLDAGKLEIVKALAVYSRSASATAAATAAHPTVTTAANVLTGGQAEDIIIMMLDDNVGVPATDTVLTVSALNATFIWLENLPACIHALLGYKTTPPLARDSARVISYSVRMCLLDALLQLPFTLFTGTVYAVERHMEFLDRVIGEAMASKPTATLVFNPNTGRIRAMPLSVLETTVCNMPDTAMDLRHGLRDRAIEDTPSLAALFTQ